MPKATPLRAAVPIQLESVDPVAIFVKDGPGAGQVPFVNGNEETIIPGEPIVKFGRLGIVKSPVLPGEMSEMCVGCILDVILNPDEEEEIEEGDNVYFDHDLGDYGMASSQQPTNGVLLGPALLEFHKASAVPRSYAGNPLAAESGYRYVRVLCTTGTPTTYGTIPTF